MKSFDCAWYMVMLASECVHIGFLIGWYLTTIEILQIWSPLSQVYFNHHSWRFLHISFNSNCIGVIFSCSLYYIDFKNQTRWTFWLPGFSFSCRVRVAHICIPPPTWVNRQFMNCLKYSYFENKHKWIVLSWTLKFPL